jgi:CO dehydrogenase maturation factor
VSDPTLRGITTAGRVVELISELKTHVGKHFLVVNRVTGDLTLELLTAIERLHLNLAGTVPMDPMVAQFDAVGRPMVDLPADSPVCMAMRDLAKRVLP